MRQCAPSRAAPAAWASTWRAESDHGSRRKRMKPWAEKIVAGQAVSDRRGLEARQGIRHRQVRRSRSTSRSTSASTPRKSDQQVRGSTVLPHGTGKTVRVAVFTPGRECRRGRGSRRRHRRHGRPGREDARPANSNFDVVIATPGRHARRRPARPDPRSARPDAEPEGRHGHAGRRGRGQATPRPARCVIRTDKARHHPLHDRQGELRHVDSCRENLQALLATCRRPSRRRRRASTCSGSPCRRRWVPACRSTSRRSRRAAG